MTRVEQRDDGFWIVPDVELQRLHDEPRPGPYDAEDEAYDAAIEYDRLVQAEKVGGYGNPAAGPTREGKTFGEI